MSDAAIANIVTGVVTVTITIVGFLTMYVKLKYGEKKTDDLIEKADKVEEKIDVNTKITKAGTVVAAKNASVAAEVASAAVSAATEAKAATHDMVQSINKKLNGGVDAAIEAAMKPLRDAMQDHALQNEENMKEIRSLIAANTAQLTDISKRMK